MQWLVGRAWGAAATPHHQLLRSSGPLCWAVMLGREWVKGGVQQQQQQQQRRCSVAVQARASRQRLVRLSLWRWWHLVHPLALLPPLLLPPSTSLLLLPHTCVLCALAVRRRVGAARAHFPPLQERSESSRTTPWAFLAVRLGHMRMEVSWGGGAAAAPTTSPLPNTPPHPSLRPCVQHTACCLH